MEENLPEGANRIRPLVLVVDDDSGLRESLRVILEEKYEVLDVPDGLQALDIVRSCQVDLVLLDIRLPGMDGITVLERMKGLDEQVAPCGERRDHAIDVVFDVVDMEGDPERVVAV